MTAIETTCWADPLTRAERRVLREKLARSCKRFYDAATTTRGQRRLTTREVIHSALLASAEMSDLHLDVTERAAVPERTA